MRYRFLAFSCQHMPLHDEEALSFMRAQIEEFKPSVVISLGDDFEAQAASQFDKTYPWTLKDEFEAFDLEMGKTREVAEAVSGSEVRCVKLWGNHGHNIMAMDRIDKGLRGLVNPYDHCSELSKWETPCLYVSDRELGVFRLGQVAFFHGYAAGVNSDEIQCLRFGMPYGLTISGHTHRPVPVRRAIKTKSMPLDYYYANAGCLRQLCPSYVQKNDHSQWGHAVVVGECEDWRYGDNFIPNKPLWDAEVRVLRMSEGTKPDQPDWRPDAQL